MLHITLILIRRTRTGGNPTANSIFITLRQPELLVAMLQATLASETAHAGLVAVLQSTPAFF